MSGPTILRYRQIRRADNTDDQQTPAAITGAIGASATEEDYQVYFLSQMKRIIWGANAGHWYTNFNTSGILDLSTLTEMAHVAASRRYGVALAGVKNASNRSFTTPEKFLISPGVGGITIEVYHNGLRLQGGMTTDPRIADFYPLESGGVGAGYDTVVLLTFAPNMKSNLVADYTAA